MDTILDLRESTCIYPAEFIEACRHEFRDWPALLEELDSHSLYVGPMLEDFNAKASTWLMNASGLEAAEYYPASERAQALFDHWVEIFETYMLRLAT